MKRTGFQPRTKPMSGCAISPGTAKLTVKVKTRKCGNCRTPFKTFSSFVKWCSPECGAVLGVAALAKAERKADKIRKEALKPRSKWLAEAQEAFNKFIRARDAHLPCISCGRDNESKANAGHYLSVGARPELRFNEDNCHKQCEHCNTYKSGNQAVYKPRLVDRIGADRVALLEGSHPPAKYTIDDAKAIKAAYKAKLKVVLQANEGVA